MADGIMRKDYRNAKLTELEHERNKGISKIRYKIEQYFGFLPPSSPEASRPEGRVYQPGAIDRTPYGRWEGAIYNTHQGALLPACSATEGNRLCQVMAVNTKRPLAHRADGPEGYFWPRGVKSRRRWPKRATPDR